MGTDTDTGTDLDRVDESHAGAADETARRWRNARTTTLLLDEREEGAWLATQRGAEIVGHGETAAAAAAEYCRLVDETVRE
jgi:hypothetical protein